MLSVGSIMTRELVTVPPDCPVERGLWLLRERKLHHILVLDHERLVGVLSERDLVERPPPSPRQRAKAGPDRATEVRDRMGISVETVTADESASKACRRLLDRRIGCLPVVRDGRLAGVLSESDLLRLYVCVCRYKGRAREFDPVVETVMSREVTVSAPRQSAQQAFELCRAKGIRHLPVVHEGWAVGMLSDRDLLPVIGRGEGELRKVEDLMTKDFVAVVPGTPLSVTALCMLQNSFHALPVIVDGALEGIVSSADVLRALCEIDERELESAWSGEQALHAQRVEE